jgi:manganese efflux pump family protein
VSAALGLRGLQPSERLRISLILSSFETAMPVVGLLVGHGLGSAIGTAADYIAIAILAGVGIWMLVANEEVEEERIVQLSSGRGLALIALGLSISLDELAMGFTVGLLHLSIWLAVVLIGAQAFLLAQVGMRLGARGGEALREGAERAAGIALLGVVSSCLWRSSRASPQIPPRSLSNGRGSLGGQAGRASVAPAFHYWLDACRERCSMAEVHVGADAALGKDGSRKLPRHVVGLPRRDDAVAVAVVDPTDVQIERAWASRSHLHCCQTTILDGAGDPPAWRRLRVPRWTRQSNSRRTCIVAIGAVSTRRLLSAEGSHVTKATSHTGSTTGRFWRAIGPLGPSRLPVSIAERPADTRVAVRLERDLLLLVRLRRHATTRRLVCRLDGQAQERRRARLGRRNRRPGADDRHLLPGRLSGDHPLRRAERRAGTARCRRGAPGGRGAVA